MADDWKPGDRGLCVREGLLICRCGCIHSGGGFRKGEIIEVAAVGIGPSFGDLWSACSVAVLKAPDGRNGLSVRFRKIHPLSIEERNAEIRLLTGLPAKEDA